MTAPIRIQARMEYVARQPFEPLHLRHQRWAILVCHRRAGKTRRQTTDPEKAKDSGHNLGKEFFSPLHAENLHPAK